MSPANYWLMKSEPDVYSIDDLKKEKVGHWDGVRNYQARNYMRDSMKINDVVLFYHSSTTPPGVAGLARVVRAGYPDFTGWDPKSDHYDPKASPTHPIWTMVDIEFVEKFPHFVSLDELREAQEFKGLLVLKRGMRLSIQPVQRNHFEAIVERGRKRAQSLHS